TMAAVLAAGASIFSVLSAYTVKMYRCGLSPAGGHAPPKPAVPKSVRPCTAPAGNCLPSAAPACLGKAGTRAGMLYPSQCHQPEPVGASGSYTVTAKLLVPLGAPLHFKAGDMFLPLQPKLL